MSKEKTEDNQEMETQETNTTLVPTDKEDEHDIVEQVWSKTDKIRKIFAPKLNRSQFVQFVGMGRMLGANPFKKEIYPMVIKGRLQVVVARDFYRRKAQEQPTYDGHNAYAIYENDETIIENGEIDHKASFTDRGDLVGAYALGKRKDVEKEFVTVVRFDEYNRNNRMWNSKPETMIKKVAEGQLLRTMYQGVLGGSYIEEEVYNDNHNQSQTEDGSTPTESIIIEEQDTEN